jgi:hypothetical protein
MSAVALLGRWPLDRSVAPEPACEERSIFHDITILVAPKQIHAITNECWRPDAWRHQTSPDPHATGQRRAGC